MSNRKKFEISDKNYKFTIYFSLKYCEFSENDHKELQKFFFDFEKKFAKLVKGVTSIAEFNQRTINNREHAKIFYTGVEQKFKNKYGYLLKKANLLNYNESYLTKTIVTSKTGKGKRLLSKLIIEYPVPNQEFSNNHVKCYLYPIIYENLHDK